MSAETTLSIARVMIDSQLPHLDRPFDYLIPEELKTELKPGVRVKVPFRNSVSAGFVLAVDEVLEAEYKLVEVEELVSPVPVLSPEIYQLAKAAAKRWVGTLRDVLRLAIPQRYVRVEKQWQQQKLEDESLRSSALEKLKSLEPDLLAKLKQKFGLIPDWFSTQNNRTILNADPNVVQLGESKTWVRAWTTDFTILAASVLLQNKQVIIAVPDQRDLNQLESALNEFIPPELILRLDSAQNPGERYRNFLSCLADTPKIIIGSRSVLYAPAQQLGLILIWDESDPLHAELQSPYPHSRELALLRQQQSESALIFGSYTRSVALQRLVELRWVTELVSQSSNKPKVVLPVGDDLEQGARIPSQVWQSLATGLKTGPVLVQVARPSTSLEEDSKLPTSSETAVELGKAFPGVKIVVSDGANPVLTVTKQPTIVVATRGAEPIAEEGYCAIALLDGLRMLGRQSLNVSEDCLRWWANAAVLAKPGAAVFLVRVSGELAKACVLWKFDHFASLEYQDRKSLRYPPAVRTVTITGDRSEVNHALSKLQKDLKVEVLYPDNSQLDEQHRIVVRFDYRSGDKVAELLREEAIRVSGAKLNRVTKTKPKLRFKLDEIELPI